MNITVIYTHPNPESFNHAVMETVVKAASDKGHTVTVRDLYQDVFSPTLSGSDLENLATGNTPKDIAAEQEYIKNADMLIFIYPVWWASFPAILKGYIDKVFSFGFAYNDKGGLLSGKKVMFIQSMGAPDFVYESNGLKDAITLIQKESIAEFTGLEFVSSLFFGEVPTLSREKLTAKLEEIKDYISNL
ncbi:MAG: NAD(P)H-dependent oxidoreductase [Alphaproteobacteria bacterium]|nr:NAD(P)H-dependent oxidoreductase [Alphaproteobacteria bacterium]